MLTTHLDIDTISILLYIFDENKIESQHPDPVLSVLDCMPQMLGRVQTCLGLFVKVIALTMKYLYDFD